MILKFLSIASQVKKAAFARPPNGGGAAAVGVHANLLNRVHGNVVVLVVRHVTERPR